MPPAGWTTAEQKAFLVDELKEYIRIGSKGYKKRWKALFQRWSQRWPERATALPNVPLGQALTDAQDEVLAEAWGKRQKRLRQWMRWHAGAGLTRSANNKTARLLDGLMQRKTRTKKIWEIYAKSHYVSRVKGSVPAGSNIVTVRQRIEDALKNESQEILDGLKLEQASQKAALRKGDSDDDSIEVDPLAIRKNIQELGPALLCVLEYLAKKTGWSFSMVMGGPDPISPEEGNHITSLHIGRNQQGQDFSDVYDKYDNVFVEAYGEFLNSVHGTSGMRAFEGTTKSQSPEPTTRMTEEVPAAGADTVTDHDEEEVDEDEEETTAPGDRDDEQQDANGEGEEDEEEEKGGDGEDPALEPSYIPFIPERPAHRSGNVASLPSVATPTNFAVPAGVATPGPGTSNMSSPAFLTCALQQNTGVAIPQNFSTFQDPFLTNFSSFSGPTPSSDNFWTAPAFSPSFMDLLADDTILPPFDVTMDLNSWSYNPQIGPPAYTPSASPTPAQNVATAPLDMFGRSLTEYTVAAAHQTQSQTTSFTPYQPPQFSFGSQLPHTGFFGVNHPVSPQANGSPPSDPTSFHVPIVSVQTLPAPPTEAPAAPLATVQVPPAPPKPPTEPGVINVPQQTPLSSAQSEVSDRDLGRPKRKHVPSQRAQRDNAIGNPGKENCVPLPATKGANARGKKRAPTGDVEIRQGAAVKKQKVKA